MGLLVSKWNNYVVSSFPLAKCAWTVLVQRASILPPNWEAGERNQGLLHEKPYSSRCATWDDLGPLIHNDMG